MSWTDFNGNCQPARLDAGRNRHDFVDRVASNSAGEWKALQRKGAAAFHLQFPRATPTASPPSENTIMKESPFAVAPAATAVLPAQSTQSSRASASPSSFNGVAVSTSQGTPTAPQFPFSTNTYPPPVLLPGKDNSNLNRYNWEPDNIPLADFPLEKLPPTDMKQPLTAIPQNKILPQRQSSTGSSSSPRRSLDPSSGLKIKMKINRKTNGRNQHEIVAAPLPKLGEEPVPVAKGSKKTTGATNGDLNVNGVGGSHSEIVPADEGATKKTRKRKDKGPRRPRGKKAGAAVEQLLHNGDDHTGIQEPPAKKCKLDSAAAASRQMQDASTSTASVSTQSEYDLISPLEPGTSVTLDGIVWQETSGGILVVNVTWRGKTYVGTLLDCTKHDWSPPTRVCDSPPSDMDGNRSPTKDKNPKRGRNGLAGLTDNDLRLSLPLRGGKTRRGANFQTPSSPARNAETAPSGKRKGKVSNLRGSPRGSETKDDVPVGEDGKTTKRGRRTASGSSTPSIDNPVLPLSPLLIECPEPNCCKKFTADGLRYHQQDKHPRPQLPSTIDEEKSTDSQASDLVFCTDSSRNDGADTSSLEMDAWNAMELPLPLLPVKADIQNGFPNGCSEKRSPKPKTTSAPPSVSSTFPVRPTDLALSSVISPTSTFTPAVAVVPTIPVVDSGHPLPVPAVAASIKPIDQPTTSMVASVAFPKLHSTAAVEGQTSGEDEGKGDKQRNKQRRKQPHPVSSQQKNGASVEKDEVAVGSMEVKPDAAQPLHLLKEDDVVPEVISQAKSALKSKPAIKAEPDLGKDVKTSKVTPSPALPKDPHQALPPKSPLDISPSQPLAPSVRNGVKNSKERRRLNIPENMRLPVESGGNKIPSPCTPLDLKVTASSSILSGSLKSRQSEQPKDGRASPAYSDISDDNDQDKEEREVEAPVPVPLVVQVQPDKPAYYQNIYGPPQTQYLLNTFPDSDRNVGSPSDQSKKLLQLGQFPFYHPIPGGMPGIPPDGPFSPSFAALPENIPVPPRTMEMDVKPRPPIGATPERSSPGNTSSKPRLSEGRSGKDSVELNRIQEKMDVKCKSPSTRDLLSAKVSAEIKPETSKVKEELKGPPEEHHPPVPVNKMPSQGIPQQQMFPGHTYLNMNQPFRGNMPFHPGQAAMYGMGQRQPFHLPQDQLFAAMYGAYNMPRGGMPPGLPQMPLDPAAMDIMQQTLQGLHKIHELQDHKKSSDSRRSSSASSAARKDSSNNPPKNAVSNSSEDRFSKHAPERSSPLQRGSLYPPSAMNSSRHPASQMPHHDPFPVFAGQRPPSLNLPSTNPN